MICNIYVEFGIPRNAHEVLTQIAKQNKQVELTVNEDGSITLAAQLLDYNGLDD